MLSPNRVFFEYYVGMTNLTKKVLLERLAHMLMKEADFNPDEMVTNDPFDVVLQVRYLPEAKNHPYKHGHNPGTFPPLVTSTGKVTKPKSQYNTKCPKCGSPALLLFNSIDCPKGCK